MKTMELLPPTGTMYRALVNRDRSFEGIFFVGVRTTGIFCRPTCTAKKPARENVDFFATSSDALQSGYRPCLRCHPLDSNQPQPKLIERLRAEVESAPGGRLTDKELAALSIDPSTARRQFKRHYGMTFQAYHRACRVSIIISPRRANSSLSIFPVKAWSSIFHLPQWARTFNCALGQSCSRFPWGRRAHIPGWRNAWATKTRGAQ